MVVKTLDDIEKKTKDVLLNSFSPTKLKLFLTLHEKPYFPGPGILWKAPKDQADIIFTSVFCLKKDRISHHRKVQNKDFSVNSKNHLSINFLSKKKPYFLFPKSSKEEISAISKYRISINFLAQKRQYFPFQKIENEDSLAINKRYPTLKKISYRFFFFFFFF